MVVPGKFVATNEAAAPAQPHVAYSYSQISDALLNLIVRSSLALDGIDQGAQAGRDVATAGIIEAHAWEDRAPVDEEAFETALPQRIRDQKIGHEGNADAVDRRIHHQRLVGQGKRAVDVDRFGDAVALELPAIERAAFEAEADAIVLVKVLRNDGMTALANVSGRSDGGELHRFGEAHRDHVLRHGLSEADAGVETFGDDVAQPAIGDDVEMDLRVKAEEARQQWAQDHPDRRVAGIDAHRAARDFAEIVDLLQRLRDRGYGGTQPGGKPLPRLGQRYATRRAVEQAHAETLLEAADGMADGGTGDVQLDRRRAKAAMVGHREKHVERKEIGRLMSTIHHAIKDWRDCCDSQGCLISTQSLPGDHGHRAGRRQAGGSTRQKRGQPCQRQS